MRSQTPGISVVIPTRNRKRLLVEVLRALARQTIPASDYEVIIVDNCSDDGTAEMVAALAPSLPYDLTYRRNEMNRGPVYSRNRGLDLARSPIIAFTDDDCAPEPQWLEAGRAPFGDPRVGLVSGPTINKPGQKAKFFSIGAVSVPAENRIYPTCNMFYRRTALDQVGGLDESRFLRDVAGITLECGDTDLAWRVKEQGWLSRYAQRAVMHHEVRLVSPYQWLAAHARVVLIPALVRRYPELREEITWWGPFTRPENLFFYLAVAGLITAPLVSPWLLILSLPFLARMAAFFGKGGNFLHAPRFAAQMAFITLRQAIICGCLVYGSLRARTLVL